MQQLIMGSQSGKKTEDRNQCFHTDVVAGEKLKRMAADVQALETRDCFTFLQKYINGKSYGKVCILYGLRHTGKTTLLFQSIAALIEAEMKKAVYIRIRATDTMDNLNKDMQLLDMMGYRYYFIDEVTLMEDFIDSASLLSDIHAMSGSKVILSGAESLCFWFTLNNELYDRAYTLHTTHIPYREYSRVLDIHDIDTYIRYGGTMKASGSCTEEEVFRDEKSAENYIREAICRNIRHSLACCRERKMHHLCSLYETGQLNDAVFRVIENMNYRFLVHVLMHRLQPCGHASAKACRQPQCQEIQTDILMQIDQKAMIRKLMVMLEMRIQECRQDTMTDIHMKEIKGYLKAMDLIVDCPSESIDGSNVPEEYVLFTQLGVRYCLVQAMVHALLNEPVFQAFSKQEKKLAADRILEEVKGQMLADIVLLETSGCLPKDDKAFRLFFSKGETDMVIYHAVEDVCEIYEIRHGNRIDNDAYYALQDEELIQAVEKKYGTVIRKCILYQGAEADLENGVSYRNVEEYLRHIPDLHSPTGFIGRKKLPLNHNWLLLVYTIQTLNQDMYCLNVSKTIFQNVCYILTYAGVPMGFRFSEGTYGPYSTEVKQAVMTLSNADYIAENQAGNMIEVVVNPSFRLDKTRFAEDVLNQTERAIDLIGRIKNTEHAEMIAAVLFSYEELKADHSAVKDIEVFEHVMQWKNSWKHSKDEEVADAIVGLSGFGWMNPVYTGLLPYDDDVYY